MGRTYAIPFDRVWREALALASRGTGAGGWTVTEADDGTGVIVAEAPRRLPPGTDRIRLHVTLDPDAQTRLDLESVPVSGALSLGAGRRRLRGFCAALDRALGTRPGEMLRPGNEESSRVLPSRP